jgi:hypothetical protein
MQTHQTSRQEWHAHVVRWRTSGLSRSAYCEQHGLKLHCLVYWIKRCPPESAISPALTLVRASVVSIAATPMPLVLECPNGSRLQLPANTSPEWLGALLRGLK